jgi:hypothetical protein
VLRLSTQPCEKEKDSSSGVDKTWGIMSTIFMFPHHLARDWAVSLGRLKPSTSPRLIIADLAAASPASRPQRVLRRKHANAPVFFFSIFWGMIPFLRGRPFGL